MRRRPRNHHPRSNTLAARIDHAAEEMNPFLAVVAVGLVVLNLVVLAFHVPRLPLYRTGPSASISATSDPRAGGVAGLQ